MNRAARHIIVTLAAIALLCASCGQKPRGVSSHRRVAPRAAGATLDGIDVSSHQGEIDWDKVADNDDIRFVYIKASEGKTYSSPHYTANIRHAQERGLLVGSYHYLSSRSAIEEQFRNFTRTLAQTEQDLIPMIDVEERGAWTRVQLIDSLTRMCAMLERQYGVKPMIYSTMDFYNRNLAPQFNGYHLYIGRYGDTPPQINWKGTYTIWQFSESGIMPGINAYVDQARFHPDHWLDEILMPDAE